LLATDFRSDAGDVKTPIAPNEIRLTKPPADAVGTPSKSIRLMRVDGAAVVGNSGSERRLKTRVPTAMRLSRGMKAYALERGFEPDHVGNHMFEVFKLWNLAKRSYSLDWEEVWFRWVDREVNIYNERYDRQRRQRWAAAG
jgi:hypothetical protein